MCLDQRGSLLQAVGVVDKCSALVSNRSWQLSAVLIGPDGFKALRTDLKPSDGFKMVKVSNRSSTYACTSVIAIRQGKATTPEDSYTFLENKELPQVELEPVTSCI